MGGNRLLVIPAGDTALIGVLDALPAVTLSFQTAPGSPGGLGWSCSDGPPPPRILGLRDEGDGADSNGLVEGVRVIAKVEVTLPGRYSFALRLTSASGVKMEAEAQQDLVAGPQEIAVTFAGEDWKAGGEFYQLTGIGFKTISGTGEQSFTVTPTGELQTGNWARARFAPLTARYDPRATEATGLDDNRDGFYEGLVVKTVLHSTTEGRCMLMTLLASKTGDTMGFGTWNGELHRGRNEVAFYFVAAEIARRLLPQPFYLIHAGTDCQQSLSTDVKGPRIEVPPIDVSRLKDAHCFFDWNGDGVVDEADLKVLLGRMAAAGVPVDPAGEPHKNALMLYDGAKGRRTR